MTRRLVECQMSVAKLNVMPKLRWRENKANRVLAIDRLSLETTPPRCTECLRSLSIVDAASSLQLRHDLRWRRTSTSSHVYRDCCAFSCAVLIAARNLRSSRSMREGLPMGLVLLEADPPRLESFQVHRAKGQCTIHSARDMKSPITESIWHAHCP